VSDVHIGYFLSSEEHTPSQLVEQAKWAEDAGFDCLWISDHFHPWNDEQGEASFVWSVLGALAGATTLPVTTAVTCPTVRIHPAIVAQAAATVASMMPGRFSLGVGSGEALNEQVLGDAWPLADERLAMLEEAVEVMRKLWTGEVVTHRGRYYTVEHARLYTLPDEPPPVLVSAFGPQALDVAVRIGDGFVSTSPDADSVRAFDAATGGGKPKHAGVKVCWAQDREAAMDTVHRLWPNSGLPGELSQVLRTPEHFMQATQTVTREEAVGSKAVGNDVDEHVKAVRTYLEAGFTHVFVSQMGSEQRPFFDAYREHVLPALRG
jgi:G6PDH family F420-dependent oxidoreductase